MKKKFNTFYLLILFLFIFNKAYALDSRCEVLYKNIKNNQLNLIFDELEYFPKKERSVDFDFNYDSKNETKQLFSYIFTMFFFEKMII